jgi:hypothetical protein
MSWIDLRCPECNWSEVCASDRVADWLRAAGRLRSDQLPELEIMHEVLRGISGSLNCPQCGHTGLDVCDADDEDSDWPAAATCEVCSRPIPAERLAAVPDTMVCAGCQQSIERGETVDEVEYCPRCGSVMELRPSRGPGITRYVLVCTGSPTCRPRRK